MNLKAVYRDWVGASITNYGFFKAYSPQVIKDAKNNYPKVKNGGWHFSWLGGGEKVWEKAHNCIEPFDKSSIPKKEEFVKYFEDFLKKEKKFFIKTESLQESKNEEFAPVTIDSLYPKWLLDNFLVFENYFIK